MISNSPNSIDSKSHKCYRPIAVFPVFLLVIPFLNQNGLCRLHLAVLFIQSAAYLRVIFDLEMKLLMMRSYLEHEIGYAKKS
ncbi:hypothetical protein SAMN05421863_103139 [Nitrosomonas communis]|uniref:Uncharacterized protein n=1 Tax=Nitrosomonas communis TaxID=44574 RepID=A0A1I4RAK7_9PROT|nr:hypothetical protein SAMN05421863_103139 [Nitrosomonas communis]